MILNEYFAELTDKRPAGKVKYGIIERENYHKAKK